MAWWEMAAALGLAAAQAADGAQARPDGPIFTVDGYVGNADQEAGGWFGLAGLDLRLLIPDGPDREAYWQLLAAAAERGVAVRVRFDAAAGRLAESGDHVAYPLCSLGAANGAIFGDEARNCPPGTAQARGAEGRLALGVAQLQGFPEAARRTLDEALASTPGLPPRAQALAHRTRAEASEALANDVDPADAAHDRFLAEALADYRRQVVLTPDDAAAQFSVARIFLSLGGYDEALELYRAIGQHWPEEAFEVAVRIGALYRQQGEYGRALRQLDDYASGGDERTTGMKFHYHRAWTLTLLGRDEEALREIGQGLRTQPDYPSAYLLRSCARARLGRLEDALADQRRGLELLSAMSAEPGAAIRADLERSRAVAAALQRALDSRQRGPVTTPCEGFWDRWIRPRARSPLLGAGARSRS